jgi:FkbM family methyltransferase
MELKELVIHRLRDFEVMLRAQRKADLALYMMLRQYVKLLGVSEEWLAQRFMKENVMKLGGFRFLTRPKSLDVLFFSSFYEPQTTTLINRMKGKVFLDVGAHTGRFSLIASRNFERVIAFEPHPSNFEVLVKNIELNKVSNVVPLRIALSSKSSIVSMSNFGINTGAIKVGKSGGTKAEAYALDSLIKRFMIPIKDINVVKIDVEGHEMEVLEGAKRTLKKGAPLIVIESFKKNCVVDMLTGLGYRFIRTIDFYNHVFSKQT